MSDMIAIKPYTFDVLEYIEGEEIGNPYKYQITLLDIARQIFVDSISMEEYSDDVEYYDTAAKLFDKLQYCNCNKVKDIAHRFLEQDSDDIDDFGEFTANFGDELIILLEKRGR